jgi:hypothetical protein
LKDAGIAPERLRIIQVFAGDRLPATGDCAAWLVSGTPLLGGGEGPWVQHLHAFLRRARAAKIPIFATWYGQHVVGEALSARRPYRTACRTPLWIRNPLAGFSQSDVLFAWSYVVNRLEQLQVEVIDRRGRMAGGMGRTVSGMMVALLGTVIAGVIGVRT